MSDEDKELADSVLVEAREFTLKIGNCGLYPDKAQQLITKLCDEVERLRAELTEETRLRSELKQIAQTGIAEVSSVGIALQANAVRDAVDKYAAKVVQLNEGQADEWERRSKAVDFFTSDERREYRYKAVAARELAKQIKERNT